MTVLLPRAPGFANATRQFARDESAKPRPDPDRPSAGHGSSLGSGPCGSHSRNSCVVSAGRGY